METRFQKVSFDDDKDLISIFLIIVNHIKDLNRESNLHNISKILNLSFQRMKIKFLVTIEQLSFYNKTILRVLKNIKSQVFLMKWQTIRF